MLRHREPDGLVVVAFTLLAVGFLVKAGRIPVPLLALRRVRGCADPRLHPVFGA